MIFSIDADLLYSRKCKAKLGWQSHIANDDLLVRYPEPIEIDIPVGYIAEVLDHIESPNQLFDWHYLGETTSRIYETNLDNDQWFYIYDGKYIYPSFNGLNWDDFRYENMWQEEELKGLYDSEYFDEFDYPDGEPTLDEYRKSYIKGRCQILYSWISTECDRLPDPRFHSSKHKGGWASGVWYPDDYTFLGAINIRELNLVEKKTNKKYKATFENIKKHLKDEEYFHPTSGSGSEIEDRLDQKTGLIIPQNHLLLPDQYTLPEHNRDLETTAAKIIIGGGIFVMFCYFLSYTIT